MSIKFTSNFNADSFGRQLDRAAAESVKQQIQDRLRRAPCPVHGRTATVSFTGSDIRSLQSNLSSCCEDGLEAAKAVLPLTRSA